MNSMSLLPVGCNSSFSRGAALVCLGTLAAACSAPDQKSLDESAEADVPPQIEEGDFASLGFGEGPPPDWAAFLTDPQENRVRSLADIGEADDEDPAPVEEDAEFGSSGQALGCIGCFECPNADVLAYNNNVRLNGTRRMVKVKYVYYWVEDGPLSTGWVKEDLSNEYISPDNHHRWANEQLNEAKDARIYNWAVYYRIRKDNGNFTNTVYEIVTPDNSGDICKNDTWYHLHMRQGWTL